MRYTDQSHEQPIMKDIESIYVKHADAPNLSTTLDLSAWGIPHFHDLPQVSALRGCGTQGNLAILQRALFGCCHYAPKADAQILLE